MLRYTLVACLLAGLVAADTTGTQLPGVDYTFASDITGYLAVSQDVCDITAAVDAGNWTTAAEIYENGKNSVRGDGSLRTFLAWATTEAEQEPYWGLYSTFFNDSAWINTFVASGLEGEEPYTLDGERGQVVKKGIQSNLQVAYMLHEIDSAAERTAAGEIDPATGAPHAVDEAAAIWFGTACPAGNIADVATKRANTFGTLVASAATGDCDAATNIAAAAALKGMLEAAVAGNATAFAEAQAELEKQIVIIFTQATLTYANRVEGILAEGPAADGTPADPSTQAAEGLAFFRTIAPLVARASSDADANAILDAFAAPAAGIAEQVPAAMAATLEAYGITAEEVGELEGTSSCVSA